MLHIYIEREGEKERGEKQAGRKEMQKKEKEREILGCVHMYLRKCLMQ